jgi:hypothetical protein
VPTPDTSEVESVSITTPVRVEPDPAPSEQEAGVVAAPEEREEPDEGAEHPDPADARGKVRRGRRVVRIRSHPAGEEAT